MYKKVDEGWDNVNVILADVAVAKGTIGKLMYDPTRSTDSGRPKPRPFDGNEIIGDVRAENGGEFGKDGNRRYSLQTSERTSSNLATASGKLNTTLPRVGNLSSDRSCYRQFDEFDRGYAAVVGDCRKESKEIPEHQDHSLLN